MIEAPTAGRVPANLDHTVRPVMSSVARPKSKFLSPHLTYFDAR
jgi:hypothetical protein